MVKETPKGELAQDAFESKFRELEELRVGGGVVEVIDLAPDKPKTEVPVLLAPAWSCNTEVYKPSLKILAGQQRRVISLNHPTKGESASLALEEAVRKFPNQELRKALNILGVLEQKQIEKVDVIAHSEAAINTVIAAMIHPEKFRNIVFFGPAGLIGKDTFTRLLKGFIGQAKRPETLQALPVTDQSPGWPEIPLTETEKEIAQTALKEGLKYVLENPVQAAKEVVDISKSQIHEMIRFLHEKGIGIAIINAVDDPVFPMDKMQKIVDADMIDGFLSVRGGHGELGNHPELYITAAEKMITALEEKKKKVGNELI